MMFRTTNAAGVLRLTAAFACALMFGGCGGGSGAGSSGSPATEVTAPETAPTPADSVALSASNISVAQSAGSVSLTVTRSGTGTASASVDYSTADDTAAAGTDYTTSSGTLHWDEGDTGSKTITVAVSNSTPFSGDRAFHVDLTNPSGSVTINNPGTATVTISGSASESAGSAELSATNYTVAQNAGTVTATVNRSGGSSGAVSVAYATSDGTAVAGKDYTSTHGVLEWADGDASAKTIPIDISNASSFAGTRQFSIALSDPRSGVMLGATDDATITINGNDSPRAGNLQLSAANYTVAQTAGSLKIAVNRVGGASGAISVAYATANGTAASGRDYTASSGTLKWADGDAAAKTVSIAISNASAFSGNRTFTFALSNPSAGASISSPGSAIATIAGSGSEPVGSLNLSASSYSVSQGAGSLQVAVKRSGGSSGAVSVSYSTSDGTAVAGKDYTGSSGTLNWDDGDSAAKNFTIAVSDATPFSGNKSFKLKLSNPQGGASLTSPSSATATINGNAAAAPGSLQLSASSYSVSQSTGTLSIKVNRTGGTSGAVSVGYATSNGTALAGTDYTASNGTLSWSDGDSSPKTFSIPISNTTAFSGTRSFNVALSNPGGGASTSNPVSAAVSINGSGSASSGSNFWVYYNGTFNWGADLSYGGLVVNYQSTAGNPLSGQYDISCTGNNGGFQPRAVNDDFDTTPYKYLVFRLKPTLPNQTWISGFEQKGDIVVGTKVDVTSYGPNPAVVGQWNTYKIPLGAGGYELAQGMHIYKFMLQQQTSSPSNNVWYVDNIEFTAN
jgi:hypothetical protein